MHALLAPVLPWGFGSIETLWVARMWTLRRYVPVCKERFCVAVYVMSYFSWNNFSRVLGHINTCIDVLTGPRERTRMPASDTGCTPSFHKNHPSHPETKWPMETQGTRTLWGEKKPTGGELKIIHHLHGSLVVNSICPVPPLVEDICLAGGSFRALTT